MRPRAGTPQRRRLGTRLGDQVLTDADTLHSVSAPRIRADVLADPSVDDGASQHDRRSITQPLLLASQHFTVAFMLSNASMIRPERQTMSGRLRSASSRNLSGETSRPGR